MIRTVLDVDGMMCGMCEAHVNDAVRRALPVKSVKSSHRKGRTEIISEAPLDPAAIEAALRDTGYALKGVSASEYTKKGLFSR